MKRSKISAPFELANIGLEGIVDPVVAIVVVDKEMLDAERTVVADPFFDIERFVLDDRGDAKVEFLILRVDSPCVGNATTRDSDKIFFARYLFVKRVRGPEFHQHDAADIRFKSKRTVIVMKHAPLMTAYAHVLCV